MVIETIDKAEKIEPLLIPFKRIITDSGFMAVHQVQVV
jgi:hypothetical protein